MDVYIRPLELKAGWVKRLPQQQDSYWEPMVSCINEVPHDLSVAGPCFLKAVAYRNPNSDGGKRRYKYVTQAAEVAASAEEKFTFLGRFNGRSYVMSSSAPTAQNLIQCTHKNRGRRTGDNIG